METGLELVPDPGGAAFYGPKISVQARDAIGRTWQMSTIQYDFNQPAGFGLEYQRRRRHPAAAGDDPLGEVRLDRAVLRRAHRALRRRVPGLAGAGAGGRHPGHRRAGALPDRRRAAAAGEGHPGRDRRLRRPDAEEDPHRQQAEGAVRAHRRAPPTPRPARCPSATATARSATACRSPRPSRRSSTGSPPGTTPTRPPRSRRDDRRTSQETESDQVAVVNDDGGPATVSSTSGRRTGWPTSAARTSRPATTTARSASIPHDERRGRADRGPRRDGVRGAQPVPVQRRAPDGGPVPPRARLHRPRRRRGRRAGRLHPDGDAGGARGQRRRTGSTSG